MRRMRQTEQKEGNPLQRQIYSKIYGLLNIEKYIYVDHAWWFKAIGIEKLILTIGGICAWNR